MYPTQLARRLSALTGALLVLLTNLSSLCGGFPEDLYPLHQIPFTEGSPEYEVFCGHRHSDEFSNCSHNYEFQLLRELAYDGRNHLLLGANRPVGSDLGSRGRGQPSHESAVMVQGGTNSRWGEGRATASVPGGDRTGSVTISLLAGHRESIVCSDVR
ncbi:Hypp920 [Branchiostoma lanceolatum]|uniref:Hypp920 protein n=1 Tax=Branchiostoma lanceolatum TaxID=7740 RepID=A0A8K0EKW8_BRALA|nr:Hypp920 [Branchiostoma lanceolatum]